jgi:hypothetical protein
LAAFEEVLDVVEKFLNRLNEGYEIRFYLGFLAFCHFEHDILLRLLLGVEAVVFGEIQAVDQVEVVKRFGGRVLG